MYVATGDIMYVATGDILLHIPILHPPQIGRLCPFDVYIWIFEINAPIINLNKASKSYRLQSSSSPGPPFIPLLPA